MVRGIDISEHNGAINWSSVKKSGIGFVILRDGYGRSTIDNRYFSNVSGAKNAGVKVEGVYHFSYALNETDARNEADVTVQHVKDAGLDKNTIIFFDLEYDSVRYAKDNGVNLNSSKIISFTNVFCNRVKQLGYKPGVYANGDYYYSNYNAGKAIPNEFIFWYADWRATPSEEPKSRATYWQYSESGKVSGISGNVDMNYRLKDISTSSTPTKTLTDAEIEKIAKDVISGKYGNGDERVNKLTAEGYDYTVIQSKVNDILDSQKPKETETKQDKKYTINELVKKVLAGDYGNGNERKTKLEAEGYNYDEVQAVVNRALTPGNQSVSKAKGFDNSLTGTYTVTADALNLRYIPGLLTESNVVKILYKNYKIQNWGYYTLVNGNKWLLIQDGNYTGFVDSKFVVKSK